MDAIIESYAQLVFTGNKTIDEVPSGLRSFVEDRVSSIRINVEKSMEETKKRSEEGPKCPPPEPEIF